MKQFCFTSISDLTITCKRSGCDVIDMQSHSLGTLNGVPELTLTDESSFIIITGAAVTDIEAEERNVKEKRDTEPAFPIAAQRKSPTYNAYERKQCGGAGSDSMSAENRSIVRNVHGCFNSIETFLSLCQ